MAKQLNVNLAFNADTSQAKVQIQALQKSLQDIAKLPGSASNLFDDTQIKKASQAALELQQHLSKAVNVDTGKLDLSRFSSSLKASNKDLNSYCNTLLSTGQQGQQTFLQLAQAIATADTPVTRINKKLAEMGTTLKNTARWQISSSILHGFMGAIQSAYGYAQDLNESLNNIRIVTGQSIDQMEKFAEKANKAARALSTTTTEYTNASLIYYQQGLSDSEVAERTEITIKMANAAGQSAQVVSDQMTAVWNNFDNGSKSLEYYADVMAALGAATASSTDEIAEGLNKFAAVADTVGLSYEYAASALATVTATTRQSADVVGTAFKTLFARIQDLELGKTLDDGTTLGTYSQALAKVGIDIKNTSGQMKNMDQILEEMAAKWDTLGKAEQAALAQNVAGVRQYTQLIALMDNWDFMEENLATSTGASGTLDRQADIYAESWEAAQGRVTAAAENIYDSLINDEFFISLLNGFEKVLETISGFIDGLGGLKGIISTVGSLFLTSFAKKMPEALENLKQNIMVFTGQSKKAMSEMQSQLAIKLAEQQADPHLSESYKIQLEGIAKVNTMKQKLVMASKILTSQEREEYEMKIQNVEAMYKEVAALAEKKKAAEALANTTQKTIEKNTATTATNLFTSYANQQDKISALEEKATNPTASSESTTAYIQVLETARQKAVELDMQIEKVKSAYGLEANEVDALIGTNTDQDLLAQTQKKIADKVKETTQEFTAQIKKRTGLESISNSVVSQAKAWKNVAKEIKKAEKAGNTKGLSKNIDATKQKMQQYLSILQKVAKDNGIEISAKTIEKMSRKINSMDINNIEQVTQNFENFAKKVAGDANTAIDTLDGSIEELRSNMAAMQFNDGEIKEMEEAAEGAATANQELSDSMSNIGGMADENIQGTFKMSVALTEFASTAMSLSSLITGIQSAISVFTDEGATGFEKMGAALSILMPLITSYNALTQLSTTLKNKDTIAAAANALGMKVMALIAPATVTAKTSETGAVWANTAAWYANPIMWIALIIIGVIAAIAGLIAIFSKLNDVIAANSAEGQLKAAEEVANELSTALETAKQKAEDLQSAFDSYDTVVEKLAECEKGTQEWNEALQAVNDSALSLIKNYPELATMVNEQGESAISYGDSGEMIIADWARNKLTSAANEDVLVAQAASIAANQNVRDKKVAVDEQKAVDKAKSDMSGNLYAKEAFDRAYEKYGSTMTRENYEAELSARLSEVGLSWDDTIIDSWADKAEILAEAMGELDSAVRQNTAAAEAENRAIAASALADNSIVQSSELSKDVLNASGYLYEQASSEALAQLKGSGWGTDGISKATGVNDEAEKIFAEYAEAAGITNYKLTDTTGTDKNRKFVYTDENGEEQTVSLDAMRITKASFDAMQELDSSAQQLTMQFEKLANSADLGDHALQNFLANQNFFQATGSEITDIKVNAVEAGGIEAYLDKMIGDGNGDLSDMTAQKYGFESAAEMVKAYEKELAEVEKQWAKVKETIPDTIKGIQDVSLESAQALANDYKELAAGPQGDEAVAALTERLQYLEKQMSPEKYQEFMEQIGSVDWSNWNALDDVKTILDNLGISLDLTGDKWEEFTNKMRIAGAANPADHFNNIKNALSDLRDAIKGVNPGDLIDETQYQALITLNKDLADSFIQTANGYKYIGTEQLDVNNLNLADDLKEMNEAAKVYNNAKTSYEKSSISKMANSTFDTTNYGAEADKLASEIAGKFAAKEKELGKGAGGGWYGKDDKAKAAEYKKGLEEEVAQKRKQQEEANKRNDQLKTDLKKMGNDILADKSLMEVAKAMHYDEAQIQEMINSGNYEGLQKLAKNVSVYMQEGLAGAYDSTELQEKMAATATTVNELNQMMYDGLITDTKVYQKQLTALTMDGIINAENLSQLQEAMQTGGDYSYQLVADALIRLGSEYENCSQEIDMFEQAIASGDETAIQSAQNELEAAIMLGEAAEKYGVSAEEMEIQASQIAKTYGISAKAAAKMAIENQRMNEGVSELAENWSAWKDELSKSDKTTTDYAKAAAALTKTVAKLVGASEDLELSPEFLETPDNLKLIEKAAEGDTNAINELGLAVAADTIKLIELDSAITRTLENGTTKEISLVQFENAKNTVLEGIQDLQTQVANGSISVGQSIGSMGADWANSLNEMAMATGMSVEEMNSMLSSMGVDAEVVTEYVQQKVKVPVYRTEEKVISENPRVTETKTVQSGVDEMDGVIPVAQINMGETGDKPNIKFIGNGNVSSSSTSGSSGNSKEVKPTKKSDVIERYKEIDDKLNDQERAMNDASKAADRLWGPSRLEAMRKANKALEENIELLKDRRAEAEYNLKVDKQNLKDTIKTNAGINITDAMFDEKGNFTAYDEVLGGLWNELSAAEKSAGETVDDHEQEKIDAIQKRIDAIKEAIDQYDDTNQIFKDLNTQVSDEIAKWQDNNYDDLNIKLEYEIAINESELELIDYYLGKAEGNIYSFVEAMGQYEAQSNLYTDSLQDQEDYYYKLEDAYNAGKISLQAYKEGLANSQSTIISNLQSLEESKQAMQDYYGNVISMAIEEIGLYTTEMEQLNSVLDHYSNIIEIIGKQDDTITKGKILASKANNLKNELAIQSKLYKETSANAEYWAQKMAESIEGSNEYETFKKNWQAAQQAANEAQDAMLSKTQEWAEAMKAIVENELAGLATSMEESLTGGLSFDELMTSMERRSSLQEEYLTTTNKIYETNKLMRTAQQEIDKTTNTVAKKRLQNFIRETNELQGQAKLSQYELEIQQAKYDLLLAEIALEEAQRAKSTVRLTRDSEGNFGYVYTADANAVADAEQQLADAQNNLYNIGLEGANDYQQKYAETLQESQDAITELTTMWMSGEIASEEEFNRRKQEIIEYYGEKLKQYSNLHSVALSADSRVVADAWSSDFTDMMVTTDQWKNSVDSYFKSAADSMETWAEVCATTVKESGLDDIEKSLESVDEKSKQWITTLIGEDGESGVVGALMAQVDVASKVSESAITIQDAISKTTAEYEKLLTAINDAYTAMTTPVVPPRISLSGGEYLPVDPWKTNGGNGGGTQIGGNDGGTPTGDPMRYSDYVIKQAQAYIGVEQDGSWGKKSKAKAMEMIGSSNIEDVLKAMDSKVSITLYASPSGGSIGKYTFSKGKFTITDMGYDDHYYTYKVTNTDTGFSGYVTNMDKDKLLSLDTGGYTGEWGTEGKMAMLHEKELILNADDTTNFLASLEVLREIVNTINLHSMNAQLGGLLSTPHWTGADQSQILEQQVHIEASFPGVQDRNEIEEAFNNLINRASQFVNRK